MSKLSKALIAAAGNSGGAGLMVEDVFSTYLYTGNNTTQTIDNGIDLNGEGGLMWAKARTNAYNNFLFDTERGVGKYLLSDSTAAEGDLGGSYGLYANTSGTGFVINGGGNGYNDGDAPTDYTSWTFRKAEKFFDVVTYTGNGTSTNNISHNLGSVPAFVIIKRTDVSQEWVCAHVNLSNLQANYDLHLNDTGIASQQGYASFQWNDTSINVKKVSDTLANTNASGGTYVAYLFASDAGGFGDDGSESIIKCGSFTTDASGSGLVGPDLGFEPQWVLLKNATSTASGGWWLFDAMRGFTASGGGTSYLLANSSGAEGTFGGETLNITSNGFTMPSNAFASGQTFIYIAIRRPMKTPESGTEVFAVDQSDGTNTDPAFSSGFPIDMAFYKGTAGTGGYLGSRLTGAKYLTLQDTNAEASSTNFTFDYQDAWYGGGGFVPPSSYYSWMFKRATGFFDVVAYSGNDVSPRTINHNLGAVPELIIFKARSVATDWQVHLPSALGNFDLKLNSTAATGANSVVGNLTENSFTVSSGSNLYNDTGDTYIAYLFATLAGVSKVGSYTGNGTSQTIDCGFSGGARFFLVKASSTTGDWHVFDTARGIVAGNDSYLELNTTNAEDTDEDAVDPVSSGVIVNETSGANINTSGVTYIYLAIS